MKKLFAIAIAGLSLLLLPIHAHAEIAEAEQRASFETLRFDFGAGGAEEGYTIVSASDGYDAGRGYGFADTNGVENVTAGGQGAFSDAVCFHYDSEANAFNVDLPVGVYKITVTTGDVTSTTITAEGNGQLYFLTGNNATDSFSIPVSDGQLNIYAGPGAGDDKHSISTLEIQQISTGTETKPTIWIYGDSTVCNYYNVEDTHAHGWGQFLGNYIDTDRYDVRNLAIDGMCAKILAADDSFRLAEYYGKSSDILILSIGINDYIERDITEADYSASLTDLVRRAKAKGMTVYLVKQQGELDDCIIYPITKTKWFNDSLDNISKAEKVQVLDLYTAWLTYCLENHHTVAKGLYLENELEFNRKGADKLAATMAKLLFPKKEEETPIADDPLFSDPSTIVYETKVSGGPVPNPHKGFVLTTYIPENFTSKYEYGPGGSKNNHAWDVVTICNGVHYWKDINPKEGVFNWKEIDDNIAAAWSRGMTYVIRILPYASLEGSHDNYGADHNLVPQWVFDKNAKKQRVTYLGEEGKEFDVPVWDDPIYLKACEDLATALAEHYDGDPRVELIDIRPFGDWGEWHFSTVEGSPMPSVQVQKDMIKFYSEAFDKTLLAITSDAYGEVYEYALSLGVAKRNDGLIGLANEEWNLRLSYNANIPAISENAGTYEMMLKNSNGPKGPLKWTPERLRECIEIAHLTVAAFDQDSYCGYKIYQEQKEIIDEMVNRIGYNFTVTSAKRNGNKLQVKIENTGVAPCYFDVDLCAEITDAEGNKLADFGKPLRIEKGTFHDGSVKTFVFENAGTIPVDGYISLAMYESNNPLTAGKDPTVRFDNSNTFKSNRLKLGELKSVSEKPAIGNIAGLKVAGSTTNAIRLTWDKNEAVEGYQIEQLMEDGNWKMIKKIVGADITEYRITKLTTGTGYKFRIRGYKTVPSKSYSDYTNIVTCTKLPDLTNVKVAGRSTNAVRLSWDKNAVAEGYQIEKKVGDQWKLYKKITSTDILEYRITKLTTDTAYEFRVRAYKVLDGCVSYSKYVNVNTTTK